ncbi:MAG: site-specific DNA-methyltransferase [Verrucomicrobia bacterium]|nr:site-specific DNA-methyltransferase [Verrucomicrobiota bacterium]MDA1006451.1 site-specific DNA-methyltransferase [Verrucomicrobiota bacterium]
MLALKALLPTHAGKVKCIYIDPPYNTGNEGWAYNDKVNSPMMKDWLAKTIDREDATRHDKWCCMMLPRLKLLRELMSEDGAIFVSIDDNEVQHLRCLMDEVFGEENFVANIIWEKVYSPKGTAKYFSENHDHIVCYAKGIGDFNRKLLPRTKEANARYNNPDKDPRGDWKPGDLSARNFYGDGTYSITCPGGRVIEGPPPGNYWRYSKKRLAELDADNRIWWGQDKNQVPAIKRFLSEVQDGLVPETIWTYKEVGHTQEAKKVLMELFPDDLPDFTTLKTPRLIQRILQIATDKDSLILDSFAGSGTTGHAVLKQNAEDGGTRRFILIECEEYADKITAERLRRCIKGVATAKDEKLRTGYGGSFSYFKLGAAVALQTILESKDLPTYETLAAYVFFTATGEEFNPVAIKRKTGFIGRSKGYDVYLLYTPEIEALKELALDLPTVRKLPPVKGGKDRKRLVYAPTRFMDDALLHQNGIVFAQLPYEIYERVEKAAR